MNTTIRLKIKKEVDTATARKILKLKGSIISNAFTDLIHYDDADQDNYIHYFTTLGPKREEALKHISSYIETEQISDFVYILEK